mgnify:FL=1
MTAPLDLEAIEAAARAPMMFDRPKIHCAHDEERGHAPWCFACDVADRASRPVPFSQRGRGDVLDLIAEVRRLREERQGLREDVAYVGASCDRELTIDGVALRAARLSPTRHDVERLTRERDEARADAARAREAYNIDLAGLRDTLRRADDLRVMWRERVADVASERDALRADLAATRAALRANLRCDECDELATRCHADTARFGCDAHGVGEGWADTTHAAVVREALR